MKKKTHTHLVSNVLHCKMYGRGIVGKSTILSSETSTNYFTISNVYPLASLSPIIPWETPSKARSRVALLLLRAQSPLPGRTRHSA